MSNTASPPVPLNDPQKPSTHADTHAGDTSPGGNEETRWEIVARMPGLMPATILAGRLQAEGVPVRVWQEGAGRALGLTIGILGTGYVAVPEAYVEQAQEILDDVDEVGEWDDEDVADIGEEE